MGLHWAWHALAVAGACRMTAVAFDAVVRRVVRTASLARDEHCSRVRVFELPTALSAGLHPATGTAVSTPPVEEQ
ncbi:hypothetical protein ACFWBS_53350 [Streptomyces mirabilis]|uniref:hypothetical protein n=1 Tax=Streptomyces mirabilis TaxID=68239 RepID=UPI0006CC29AB|nr:hypothetical protein OK006_8415 [Actinobacteria bacterium OK006]